MEFDSGQFGEWESGLRAINYVALYYFFPGYLLWYSVVCTFMTFKSFDKFMLT